ncbi:MAG: PDZ domain-containing protein [Nitrospiraceae bacterium]|nr:PDZ domain-containing protein [Nitrospiraceae bacterium]
MQKRQSKLEFVALLGFLVVVALILANGFVAKISAQQQDVDIYAKIDPIGDVLSKILDEYVKEPNVDKVVEGALTGMMHALDQHSDFISPDAFNRMQEDTKGEFVGIGVTIHQNEEMDIVIASPLPNSPALRAGVQAGDVIRAVDGVSTEGMTTEDAAKRIRGPKGSVVALTLERLDEGGNLTTVEVSMKRDRVELESISESRLLHDGVGYVRIDDFKDTTARDLSRKLKALLGEGMTSLVLDLRWNAGGLLKSSKQVCELFLPKNSLVTYTKGRPKNGRADEMKLYTEREALVPAGFPIAVLTNQDTASSSEIVTGALQFWSRAIIVGEKTFGKGSVQTIIPLSAPKNSALRLTTALYYTPANVTIDGNGIKPDVEVPMSIKEQRALRRQMFDSHKGDLSKINEQNHGTVSGNEVTDDTVEDVQLLRAVELLLEKDVFEQLVAEYHKDVSETQIQAAEEDILKDRSQVEHEYYQRLKDEIRELENRQDKDHSPADTEE